MKEKNNVGNNSQNGTETTASRFDPVYDDTQQPTDQSRAHRARLYGGLRPQAVGAT